MSLPLLLLAAGGVLLIAGYRGQSVGEVLRGEMGAGTGETGFARIFDVAAFRERAVAKTTSDGDSATTPASLTSGGTGGIASTGAKSIVDSCAAIGRRHGATVVSSYRPGDPKDHGSNDTDKAARDIAMPGINALTGPPHRNLDAACKEICDALGYHGYKPGTTIIRNITFEGYRVQVIWRTPAYGGHMGHIHVGARKL